MMRAQCGKVARAEYCLPDHLPGMKSTITEPKFENGMGLPSRSESVGTISIWNNKRFATFKKKNCSLNNHNLLNNMNSVY